MKIYQGKEICQGCKISGALKPRPIKDDLCRSCKLILNKGKTKHEEEDTEYTFTFLHSNAQFHKNALDFGHKILGILHKENAEFRYRDRIHDQYVGNYGIEYKIPKKSFEPVKSLIIELSKSYKDIENENKNLEVQAKEVVQKLKDEIFNEGIKRGKNLLLMLECGELTMHDFAKNLPYHKF